LGHVDSEPRNPLEVVNVAGPDCRVARQCDRTNPSIRRRESIGPWLHGVAIRVARRARVDRARRNVLETPITAERLAGENRSEEGLVELVGILIEKAEEWRLERNPEPRPLMEQMSKEQALEQIKQLEESLRLTLDAKELEELVKAEQTKKRTELIRERLTRKFEATPTRQSPFGDFLKAIKKASLGPNDAGIPVHVNPIGLEDAGQTMESVVTVEPGGTLGETLQKALKPLHLWYDIQGGMLVIDSRLGIVESGLQRVEDKLDRLINRMKAK